MAQLGCPESLLSDPTDVAHKLAGKIESREPMIDADWKTKLSLAVSERVPYLVQKRTEQFVEPAE